MGRSILLRRYMFLGSGQPNARFNWKSVKELLPSQLLLFVGFNFVKWSSSRNGGFRFADQAFKRSKGNHIFHCIFERKTPNGFGIALKNRFFSNESLCFSVKSHCWGDCIKANFFCDAEMANVEESMKTLLTGALRAFLGPANWLSRGQMVEKFTFVCYT